MSESSISGKVLGTWAGHRVCLTALSAHERCARNPSPDGGALDPSASHPMKEDVMPTSKSTSTKSSSSKSASHGKTTSQPEAVKLLVKDHREVSKLFKAYQKLVKDEASADEKTALVQEICTMLKVHTMIEEEIFYPVARDIVEQDMVDEAVVEHASAKDLIAQIEAMQPDEELYDAKVTVLGEYIEHHVKEEEEEMFPKVTKARSDVDFDELGEQMSARKEELMSEMGADGAVH